MLPRRVPVSYVNQRNFRIAIAAIFFAAVIGFFVYQFKFLRAPSLDVLAPGEDIETRQGAFDVRGLSDPDADVTVNGRPLYMGADGIFEERLYLVRGVNRLEFQAKNRYGKMTEITRYVVVE